MVSAAVPAGVRIASGIRVNLFAQRPVNIVGPDFVLLGERGVDGPTDLSTTLEMVCTAPGRGSYTVDVSMSDVGPLSLTILAVLATRDVTGRTLMIVDCVEAIGPVRVLGTFTNGRPAECGELAQFTLDLDITQQSGMVTIVRLGTGEVFEGTIDLGGVFTASNAAGNRTFSGTLQPDGSGTGMKTSTDANGCTTTWDATFTPTPNPLTDTGLEEVIP